jgi:membrane-associated phospholipid phosphatase
MRSSLQATWVFITNLGDTAVTVPLALLTCCFLGAAQQTRLAFGWSFAILSCAGIVGVLKLLLATCGDRLAISGLSPSGHTAMSTAVYGSLCLLIANSSPAVVRAIIYTGGLLLVADIAASRLALRYHSPVEVAVGVIIGVGAVAAFRIILANRPIVALPVQWLIGTAVVLVALLHGERWPAEQTLHGFAGFLRILIPMCRAA